MTFLTLTEYLLRHNMWLKPSAQQHRREVSAVSNEDGEDLCFDIGSDRSSLSSTLR